MFQIICKISIFAILALFIFHLLTIPLAYKASLIPFPLPHHTIDFSLFSSQFSHVGFHSHISTFDHWQLANHCPFLCWRPTGLWGTLCHNDIESFRCSQVNLETQTLNWKHISAEMRCRFSCTYRVCWNLVRWCHCREKGKQTKGTELSKVMTQFFLLEGFQSIISPLFCA